jgi:glucose-6-phosphate 1-dehydrogenase
LSQKRTEIGFYFETYKVIFNVSPLLKIKVISTEETELALMELHPLKLLQFINEDAYVKIFKDILNQNQTLFPSSHEIEATWRLVDQIKQQRILPKLYRHENDLLGASYE